ncbi:hypothetical protein N0V87_006484 [Didymella glomerata]|uniref:Uncharacterized protein n=1 Tax=Didymella glomerata TaxID=749621 RepID=A0A9W8WXX5_9PLEO|nr:hypothetical protein N0V87_006484 [Didymella glomerata]
MTSDASYGLDYLFNNEDPHAIIEAERRQQGVSESDDEAASESEEELLKAFEDEGGFGNNRVGEQSGKPGNGDDSNEEDTTENQHIDSQSVGLDAPLSPTISQPPALLPLKLTVNTIGGHTQVDADDSDQLFGHVPLNAPLPITPEHITPVA